MIILLVKNESNQAGVLPFVFIIFLLLHLMGLIRDVDCECHLIDVNAL